MNKVIRTARISAQPVVLPIHVDRSRVELPFVAVEDTITEEEFEAAQKQDIEESAEFTALSEQVEVVEEEPKLSMEEVEALIEARLKEAEAQFAQEMEQAKEVAQQAGMEAGQAQGYEDGHAKGLAEGEAKSQDEIVRFQAMVAKLADRWEQVFQSVDLDVTHLAFAIAQNIVGGVADAQEDLVLQSVRECLTHVEDRTKLTVCVNPDDLAIVRAHRSQWQEMYEGITSLLIEADSSIERGGCIVETPSGDIDGQISSRLEKLQKAILERLQEDVLEAAPDVSDVVAEADVEVDVLDETSSKEGQEEASAIADLESTVEAEETQVDNTATEAETGGEERVDVADDHIAPGSVSPEEIEAEIQVEETTSHNPVQSDDDEGETGLGLDTENVVQDMPVEDLETDETAGGEEEDLVTDVASDVEDASPTDLEEENKTEDLGLPADERGLETDEGTDASDDASLNADEHETGPDEDHQS